MDTPRRSLLVAAFLVVSIVWGSTYLVIRFALDSYPPFLLGAVRFLLAGAALYAFARTRGERTPRAVEWGAGALTGVLFFVVGNGLVNVAEQSVSSGLASVLVASMPLWATLFSRAFGQRSSAGETAGVLLGMVGVAVLVGGDLRGSPGGAACALLAPMGWALGSVTSKRLPLPAGTMRTATQMISGGAAMLLVGLLRGEHLAHPFAPRALAAVAYLTVFGSLLGFTAYSYLLRHTRPAIATSYAYVNPVIAVLAGVVAANEHFGASSFVGAAIVLASVAIVGRSVRRASPARLARRDDDQGLELQPEVITQRANG
jgi:drug/metabolite transporter (DMT)-like permease